MTNISHNTWNNLISKMYSCRGTENVLNSRTTPNSNENFPKPHTKLKLSVSTFSWTFDSWMLLKIIILLQLTVAFLKTQCELSSSVKGTYRSQIIYTKFNIFEISKFVCDKLVDVEEAAYDICMMISLPPIAAVNVDSFVA